MLPSKLVFIALLTIFHVYLAESRRPTHRPRTYNQALPETRTGKNSTKTAVLSDDQNLTDGKINQVQISPTRTIKEDSIDKFDQDRIVFPDAIDENPDRPRVVPKLKNKDKKKTKPKRVESRHHGTLAYLDYSFFK